MNLAKWPREKVEDYCRWFKKRLENLSRTLARLTGQDRLALTARIRWLQNEFESLCLDTPAPATPDPEI